MKFTSGSKIIYDKISVTKLSIVRKTFSALKARPYLIIIITLKCIIFGVERGGI